MVFFGGGLMIIWFSENSPFTKDLNNIVFEGELNVVA